MSFQNIEQALQAFLTADNNLRKGAEEFLNNIPKSNFDEGIDQFLSGMDIQNESIAQLAALYLKKKYLDDEAMLQRLNEQSITKIVTKVQNSVNESKNFSYLQRSFEILVKITKKKLFYLKNSFFQFFFIGEIVLFCQKRRNDYDPYPKFSSKLLRCQD